MMQDKNVEALNKRTRFDVICTLIFSGIFAAAAILKAIQRTPGTACSNLFLFVIFLLTGLIFLDIRKCGKPFAKSVIRKTQILAITVMCSGIVPDLIDSFFRGIASQHFTLYLDDRHTLTTMLLGIVIGILSEIFVYGHALQDDMDQIA